MMKMMTKKSGGLIVALAVAVGLAASPIQAQRGPGARGQGPGFGQGPGPNMGNALDAILENQEALELSGDQLRELEALKATMDSEVKPLAEEMKALRDRVVAGEVDRDEGARQLQALRGRLLIASAPLQGRVQEILTVEQHQIIQRQMRANRPGAGRGGAEFQGRGGMRGGRGQIRGSRGGYGPRTMRAPQGRRPWRGGEDLPADTGAFPPKG